MSRFYRHETSKIEDKNRIKAEISDEVEEQREDYQQKFIKLKSDYDAALAKYKQQLKAKVICLLVNDFVAGCNK